MARKSRSGNRGGRQPNQGGRGGGSPSSLQNPTVSGSANTAAPVPNASANNSLPSGNIPAIVISAASGDSHAGNQIPVARNEYLAPPARSRRSVRHRDALSANEVEGMLRVFGSGAEYRDVKAAPKLFVTVHLAWPASVLGFKDIDPADVDIKATFSQVAKQHQARIEAEEDGSAITIQAVTRAKVKEVIADLRRQLVNRSEESVWRTQLLVHPPKNGKAYFQVVLEHKEGDDGVRPSARNQVPVEGADISADMTEYKVKLRNALDEVASILRHSPNGMRMRVHFGTVVLKEWKKDMMAYNFEQFESLVGRVATRGTAHMLNIVGKNARQGLKSKLFAASSGLPQSAQSFIDPDTAPTYSIIMQTKNLHIESALESVQAQGNLRQQTKQLRQYAPGPLVARQQEKQDRAVKIVTVCPESSHDWALEIVKVVADEESKAKPPFTVHNLDKHLRFTGGTVGGSFPNFTIGKDFLRHHEIQSLQAKATWNYVLSGLYSLKITVHHIWKDNNASLTPVTKATLELYSEDWDEHMRPGVSPPRPWTGGFSFQFLKPYPGDEAPSTPANANDRLSHFLAWVHWIQQALDSSLEESSAPNGENA